MIKIENISEFPGDSLIRMRFSKLKELTESYSDHKSGDIIGVNVKKYNYMQLKALICPLSTKNKISDVVINLVEGAHANAVRDVNHFVQSRCC